MTDQQLREAFESEYSKLECLRDDAGEYIDAVTWGDWVAFKRGHAAAQPKWLPIEQAPKDGTEVLLMSNKGRIANGLWVTVNGDLGYWAWPYVKVEPTHFMPLPPGPGERG